MVAYGNVTDPAIVPGTGTAGYYDGFAYGWNVPNGSSEAVIVSGGLSGPSQPNSAARTRGRVRGAAQPS